MIRNYILLGCLLLLAQSAISQQQYTFFNSPELRAFYTVTKNKEATTEKFWRKTGESAYESCSGKEWVFTYSVFAENPTPQYYKFTSETVPIGACFSREKMEWSTISSTLAPGQTKLLEIIKVSEDSENAVTKFELQKLAREAFDYFELTDLVKTGAKANQLHRQDVRAVPLSELMSLGICPFEFPDQQKYSTPEWLLSIKTAGWPHQYESDTTVVKIKRDKTGALTEYEYTIGNLFKETFNQKSGWKIQFVNVIDSVTHTGSSALIQFDVKGRKTEEHSYTYNGEYMDVLKEKDIYYYTEYYASGQVKIKWEIKRVSNGKLVEKWEPWNILAYHYPDGKPFTDFGNFKDGKGTYKTLDDQGKLKK